MRRQNDVTINGKPLRLFGAKMQMWPDVGACEIDTGIYQGAGRSQLHQIQNRRGGRTMKLRIDFLGVVEQRTENQSSLDALFASGPVEIDWGDGYLYRAILSGAGTPQADHNVLCTVEYTFRATRHRTARCLMVTAPATVRCLSNVPLTDCRIRIPFDSALQSVSGLQVILGSSGWYYGGEITGDIVLDGIDKSFTMGSKVISQDLQWSRFPVLVPGDNTVRILRDTEEATEPMEHDVEIVYSPTFL